MAPARFAGSGSFSVASRSGSPPSPGCSRRRARSSPGCARTGGRSSGATSPCVPSIRISPRSIGLAWSKPRRRSPTLRRCAPWRADRAPRPACSSSSRRWTAGIPCSAASRHGAAMARPFLLPRRWRRPAAGGARSWIPRSPSASSSRREIPSPSEVLRSRCGGRSSASPTAPVRAGRSASGLGSW